MSREFSRVLVLDMGAQYAQLIARRVREAHVYSEIVPHTITADEVIERRPAALIFSGGPKSTVKPCSGMLAPDSEGIAGTSNDTVPIPSRVAANVGSTTGANPLSAKAPKNPRNRGIGTGARPVPSRMTPCSGVGEP